MRPFFYVYEFAYICIYADMNLHTLRNEPHPQIHTPHVGETEGRETGRWKACRKGYMRWKACRKGRWKACRKGYIFAGVRSKA